MENDLSPIPLWGIIKELVRKSKEKTDALAVTKPLPG